jgi:hypothetical protein
MESVLLQMIEISLLHNPVAVDLGRLKCWYGSLQAPFEVRSGFHKIVYSLRKSIHLLGPIRVLKTPAPVPLIVPLLHCSIVPLSFMRVYPDIPSLQLHPDPFKLKSFPSPSHNLDCPKKKFEERSVFTHSDLHCLDAYRPGRAGPT